MEICGGLLLRRTRSASLFFVRALRFSQPGAEWAALEQPPPRPGRAWVALKQGLPRGTGAPARPHRVAAFPRDAAKARGFLSLRCPVPGCPLLSCRVQPLGALAAVGAVQLLTQRPSRSAGAPCPLSDAAARPLPTTSSSPSSPSSPSASTSCFVFPIVLPAFW